MRRLQILCWIFWLGLVGAWGQPLPDSMTVGDNLARLGDYERADASYMQAQTQEPGKLRRLLSARLALAQAQNHVAQAHKLARAFEIALRTPVRESDWGDLKF